MSTSWGTALQWIPQNAFDDKSTLVQIMAWCCQAIRLYLSQCWPRPIWPQWVNPMASGKFEWNFWYVIFKQILVIDAWGISCEIALIWMSQDFTDNQSTLVQVMAWCRQATSHYLSQCWPRSLPQYGVSTPQWVNQPWSQLDLSNQTQPCISYLSPSSPGILIPQSLKYIPGFSNQDQPHFPRLFQTPCSMTLHINMQSYLGCGTVYSSCWTRWLGKGGCLCNNDYMKFTASPGLSKVPIQYENLAWSVWEFLY